MTAALVLYDAALRRAARGHAAPLHLLDGSGTAIQRLDAARYTTARPGDPSILARCAGPTVDLGCGPGRLAGALAARRIPVLGVDLSVAAVRATRRRGAPALRGDLFDPLPDEGRWRHALLIDGNVGIGGDPVRLLTRCAALLAPAGDVLVECDPPGTPSWQAPVALTDGPRVSDVFPWAAVAAPDLPALAIAAGLARLETWTEAGRWFARLGPVSSRN